MKGRLRARCYGTAMAIALRLLRATWRVDDREVDRIDRMLEGRRLIVGFWHGDYIPLFILLRDHDACIFTSRSFRGTVIATICRSFGYHAELIPESGEEAYENMRRAVEREQLVGLAVDGPLGPFHVVKRGPIRLAADTGMAFLAVGVATSRSHTDDHRWDRQTIPSLFSRVALAASDPVQIPAGLEDEEIENWRLRIGSMLIESHAAAEARLSEIRDSS